MTLPIAALTFAALYVAAHKAPHAVEIGSMILWAILPLVVVAAVAGKRRKH
jgi:hypothetical protein